MQECRNLRAAVVSTESVSYVYIPGTASVDSALLSSDLLAELKKAGWTQKQKLQADSDIYFLEDDCYDRYLRSCVIPRQVSFTDERIFPVLVNRYINHTSFKENTSHLFRETALLNADAKKAIGTNAADRTARSGPDEKRMMDGKAADFSDLKIYCGILPEQPDQRRSINPVVCCDDFPEGIHAGNIAVILPLSRLSAFCPDSGQYGQGMRVCALFADTDDTLFHTLQQKLGMDAAGNLRNDRKEYLIWYHSLREIHLALLSVCGILFFTALLEVFCTMLFHCMQRRRGLAVLWSLGETRQGLTMILALESLRGFVWAMLLALPASCGLCYFIYRIYRYVWQTDFTLPLGQFVRIAVMFAVAGAAAVAVSQNRMNRQDFLKEIREQ